jgi:hypothetical protein
METRLREVLRAYLNARPRNTAEIQNHVLETIEGTSLKEIEMLLNQDTTIVRVGLIRRSGMLSGGHDICEWATKEWMEARGPPDQR